jgi:hypothetical protein
MNHLERAVGRNILEGGVFSEHVVGRYLVDVRVIEHGAQRTLEPFDVIAKPANIKVRSDGMRLTSLDRWAD